MHYDPQQELFTALKLGIEAKGYAVYDDGLPGEDAKYPFVYLGETRQADIGTKTAIMGNVFQHIQIWHTKKNRGTLSQITLDVKNVCRALAKTSNFVWKVTGVSGTIRSDKTTAIPLLFSDLNVKFYFS